MGEWTAFLKSDPMPWLLEEENPSVRRFTLTDLLDVPSDDPSVQAESRRITEKGLVPQILERMRDPSYIAAFPRFYTNKYEGLVWQLIVLAELGAQADAQIAQQCAYILAHAQTQTGGFSQHASAKEGGRLSEIIPCLSGNMMFCILRFGLYDDPRVQQGIDWLARTMILSDGVEMTPKEPPYDSYDACWGRHTCHMGVVKALKAFAEIPAEKRSEAASVTLENCAQFMLLHHVHKRSHNLGRISKPGWQRFGFPLMYQTDALEILDILTALGYRDERMEEAIALVLSKQDGQGRWALENDYANTRLLVPFGAKGEPDKWITLRALRVLKRFYG